MNKAIHPLQLPLEALLWTSSETSAPLREFLCTERTLIVLLRHLN